MAKLCIVGMACSVGDGDLDAFERTIYAGERGLNETSGAQMAPEQLAVRLVAQHLPDMGQDLRVGTVVCGDEQPVALAQGVAGEIGGSVKGGPTAGVAADDLVGAFALVSRWLAEDSVDLALIVSVGARSAALPRSLLPSAALLVSGEDPELGNAAFLAQAYAVVESVTTEPKSDNGIVLRRAIEAAHLAFDDVGYLETTRWPPADALVRAYSTGTSELTCAVGSLDAGDRPGAAMIALIKAALCVHWRMLVPTLPAEPVLPATAPLTALEFDRDVAWRGTSFYTVSEARPWFSDGAEDRRIAHVAFPTAGGMGHVFLSEPLVRQPAPAFRPDLSARRSYLLPVVGNSRDALLAGVEMAQAQLEETATSVATLSAAACETAGAGDDAHYALSIVGRDREELLKELGFAVEGVARAFDMGKEWQTPRGSRFTAMPLGEHGVTFVYPGVFNSYIGVGRDLFQHFPWLHERLAELTPHLGLLLAEGWLYPRSRRLLTKEDLAACLVSLQDNPVAMSGSGSSVAITHTLILQELFGVAPRAAMGYSMGEGTMFWATGVWRDVDAGGRALHTSPLFSTMISGPRTTVKAYWGLEPEEDVNWTTYLLKAKVDRVQKTVAEEPKVFVTFINLVNEVVIAGDEAGCRRVIAALDCHALPVPASVAIHNEAIHGAYDALVDLYTHPVAARPDMAFYSTATYDKLELDEAGLADALATMCCQPVDFPRLVSHVYDEGARIFVELGPLATCTRRIRRILRGKPHISIALNPSPGDDLDGVIRALAALVAHRVPVDLSVLHTQPFRQPLQITAKPREQAATLPSRPVSRAPEPLVPAPAMVTQVSAVPIPVRERAPIAGVGARLRRAPTGSAEGVSPSKGLIDLYTGHLLPYRQGAAQVHNAFLQTRTDAQLRAGSLIGLQIAAGRRLLAGTHASEETAEVLTVSTPAFQRSNVHTSQPSTSLFDEGAVREFASGDVTACFGPDFEIYRGRRLSRIPNGELLMMSRVMEVEGEPGTVAPPATLWSEFDIPADAWFYEGAGYPGLPPNIVLMEMALQPCGFLSAYLRSSFLDPDADLYFRNLDGRGRILADLDLRGKLVCDEVQLLSSTRGQGAIIQTYEFTLSCEGTIFYEGWSSFGYFSKKSLARQSGLGPVGQEPAAAEGATHLSVDRRRVPVQLQQVTEVRVSEPAGQSGCANLSTEGRISPSDWFFQAHFYQDPVMPGSLGVEAAFQAMVGYARWRYPKVSGGVTRQIVDHEMVWKYRGQITPEDRQWRVAVQLTDVRVDATGVTLFGDASVWKDDVRIYQINGVAVSLTQQ
ncbi:MAG: PfaB family protein [Anaerolineae bacterium]|nr:PfaB family protein [Anaerolineae bacterium]